MLAVHAGRPLPADPDAENPGSLHPGGTVHGLRLRAVQRHGLRLVTTGTTAMIDQNATTDPGRCTTSLMRIASYQAQVLRS